MLAKGAAPNEADEHEALLGQNNPARSNLPKHAQMALNIIEAEHLSECDNNFDTYEPTRASRFVTLEFIGTCFTIEKNENGVNGVTILDCNYRENLFFY